jgi:spoIIIJ-associated protein
MTGSVPDLAVSGEETSEETDMPAPQEDRLTDLEQEGEIAADYIEGLLDIVDMDGDLDLDVEGGRAVVAVVGNGLDKLIGPHGETLEALQELTRLAVLQKTGIRSRLMLDVGGHRARRRAELRELAVAAAGRVAGSTEPEKLAPMTPFERKVVHDVIATVDGVHSESEGEEPNRRVVVIPG